MTGKAKASVKLESDGGNAQKGAGTFAVGPDTKVIVTVGMPGKGPEQARFAPREKAAPADHKGHKH